MQSKRSLLVILAHPDDESFTIGGTLAKYASEGVDVSLICATSGERGIPGIPPVQAANIREGELRAAALELGIRKVDFLHYRDGKLKDVDPEVLNSKLENAFRRLNPQIVITFGPDGISGHPDHISIHKAVTKTFDRATRKKFLSLSSRLFYITPSQTTLQGCGVIPPSETPEGSVAAIDITDYRVKKVSAMQAHSSQNPPYPGDLEEEASRLACHEYFTLTHPVPPHLIKLTDLFLN